MKEYKNDIHAMDVKSMFIHDMFNICALGGILILVCRYLHMNYSSLTNMIDNSSQYSEVRIMNNENDDGCNLFVFIMRTLYAYLIVDMFWVVLFPRCIPSSRFSIVMHHIVTMILITPPYMYIEFNSWSWLTCVTLLVELNTLCLISRRNISSKRYFYKVANICFYLTWIVQRLIMFPTLTYFYYDAWITYSKFIGRYWNVLSVAPFGGLILTCLNYYWTIQLLQKNQNLRDQTEEKKS
jgi:hypothetical protein